MLEVIHSDVCGKIDPQSIGESSYFITFTDDASHYTRVYFLKKKSEVFEKFKQFQQVSERETGQKIKVLRTDNGGEYMSRQFEQDLQNKGIQRQLTVPKTPEQNGVAERLNRMLVEKVRAMLADSMMPKKFWAEALSTAVYLTNRSPTATLKTTPFEAYYGRQPVVTHLKVFGCAAYAHIPKDERKKLDSKAKKSWFVGYSTCSKGYRLYDVDRDRIFLSRDVIFNEAESYNESPSTRNQKEPHLKKVAINVSGEEPPQPVEQPQIHEAPPQVQVRRSGRERRAPDWYGDWVMTASSEDSEPKTMAEAFRASDGKLWKEAAQKEYDSLLENETWDLVPLPKGRKTVDCKWVFKVKRNADGSVERYKARLVAKGFTQKFGVDYDETFSPVVRFESVRTIVALAAHMGMKLHQMDVTTAFLNGTLNEEIYMKQPEGFVVNENQVCKLKKSLYGLKQSPRCWNEALHKELCALNYNQSDSDPCIYVKKTQTSLVFLAVYVDDIILASKSDNELQHLKKELAERFKMRDLGPLHYFLGVKVEQKESSILLQQEKYIEKMLEKYEMKDANPVATPMDPNVKMAKSTTESNLANQQLYQSAVGSLLYVAIATRPDVSAAVSQVAKFCSAPSTEHWTAVKRIFRYLKGTKQLGLVYTRKEDKMKIFWATAMPIGRVTRRIDTRQLDSFSS